MFIILFIYFKSAAGSDTCDPPADLSWSTAPITSLLCSTCYLKSQLEHDCGPGQVFSDTKKQTKANFCLPQASGGLDWQYSASNPLPECIRK